ncbi:MAG: hypothetical protein ACRCTR_06235 [Actinomycetota bacterium]
MGVALALFGGGIAWVVINGSNRSSPHATPASTPTTSNGMPTAKAMPSPTTPPATAFDVDEAYALTATKTGVAAATWSGSSTAAQLRSAYVAAGISDQLATSFTPLWHQVFDVPKVFHFPDAAGGKPVISAETHADYDGAPDIVLTTGQAPHRQFRFAVNITYRASWDQKAGSDNFNHDGKATWFVTVDEATGKAVAVEQPRTSMTELTAAINAAKSRF